MSGEWLSPAQAADMVYLDPQGRTEGFSYGVLRRELRGKPNDLVAFVRAKLQPIMPMTASSCVMDWPVTAAGWCLLLPPGVPDELGRPEFLFPHYREALLEREKAMLIVITLRFRENRKRPVRVSRQAGR